MTYVLRSTDVGSRVRVVETATNAGGNGLGASSAPTAAVRPLPPVTLGVIARISSLNHRAAFQLRARGRVSGFQCVLISVPRHGRKAHVHYHSCNKNVTFKDLRSGRYVLYVRAVGPGGRDQSPVTYRFRIR